MAQHHWTTFREQDGSTTLTLEVTTEYGKVVTRIKNAFSGDATAECNFAAMTVPAQDEEMISTSIQNIAPHLVCVEPSTICQIIEDMISNT